MATVSERPPGFLPLSHPSRVEGAAVHGGLAHQRGRSGDRAVKRRALGEVRRAQPATEMLATRLSWPWPEAPAPGVGWVGSSGSCEGRSVPGLCPRRVHGHLCLHTMFSRVSVSVSARPLCVTVTPG